MLQLNLDPEASMRLQMTKSFAFIIATALLLFFLLQQIEVRKRPEMGSKPSPPSVWMPVILFSLLMALAVIPGIIAYYEVSRHFGESTTRTWLFAWDGLVLLFALTTAASCCILCWWRTTRSRFALERFHDENEQSKLRHRYEALLRQSLDVVLLLAEDGTIIDANDCVREYYGRTPENYGASTYGNCAFRARGIGSLTTTVGSPKPAASCSSGCTSVQMVLHSPLKSAQERSAIINGTTFSQ